MKLIPPLVALAMLSACAAGPTVDSQYADCNKKHGEPLPAGLKVAKATTSLHVRPPRLTPHSAFACVLANIDEAGVVRDVRLLETDYPEYGELFASQVKKTRFHPATLDGKPVA